MTIEELFARLSELRRRLRRMERRELSEMRSWLERTSNLSHLAVLVFVPLLVGLVTLLSRSVRTVSFLLFPPLASGAYTLFADPEGRYSSPRRFVGGLTLGAFCGWVALAVSSRLLLHVSPSQFHTTASAAALSVLFTVVATWALDLELPTAFSTALLVLLTGSSQLAYVLGVFLSSSLVAAVFLVYRERFYEQRHRYLYGTVGADDHVLVPMLGDSDSEAARFAASLAGAHDDGRVVLLDFVPDGESTASAEDSGTEPADRLASEAADLEAAAGVDCEVIGVAADVTAGAVLDVAAETRSDLIVVPHDGTDETESLAASLFDADIDTVAFRSATGRRQWERPMIAARRAGATAHAMLDYADRLVGAAGAVSVCHCIVSEGERRRAEEMLAGLVETVDARVETRVSRLPIEEFLERTHRQYDVLFVGASAERSTASRLLSPPTFERIDDLEADVAIVAVD